MATVVGPPILDNSLQQALLGAVNPLVQGYLKGRQRKLLAQDISNFQNYQQSQDPNLVARANTALQGFPFAGQGLPLSPLQNPNFVGPIQPSNQLGPRMQGIALPQNIIPQLQQPQIDPSQIQPPVAQSDLFSQLQAGGLASQIFQDPQQKRLAEAQIEHLQARAEAERRGKPRKLTADENKKNLSNAVQGYSASVAGSDDEKRWLEMMRRHPNANTFFNPNAKIETGKDALTGHEFFDQMIKNPKFRKLMTKVGGRTGKNKKFGSVSRKAMLKHAITKLVSRGFTVDSVQAAFNRWYDDIGSDTSEPRLLGTDKEGNLIGSYNGGYDWVPLNPKPNTIPPPRLPASALDAPFQVPGTFGRF